MTLIPIVENTATQAQAATAGTYTVRVRIKTTDSVDVGDEKDLVITLHHKGNNGKGSALTNETANVPYTWAEKDNADNTYTFTGCGYPTSVDVYCLYAWTAAVSRKWAFTLYVYVLDKDTNTYTQVASKSFSENGGLWGQTEKTFTLSSIGSTPAITRISWSNTAKTVTVPKTGTATVTANSATIYDQYGVEWYQEPYYAINTSSDATTTTESITGITRTTSRADKCTVSVTNSARDWVAAGGGTSRDVYVTHIRVR